MCDVCQQFRRTVSTYTTELGITPFEIWAIRHISPTFVIISFLFDTIDVEHFLNYMETCNTCIYNSAYSVLGSMDCIIKCA